MMDYKALIYYQRKKLRTLLEYIKAILLKVSFDNMLFEKELRKGLRTLVREEQLRKWCYEKFSGLHQVTLSRVFQQTLFSGVSKA